MLDERLSLPWKVLRLNDDPEIESIPTAFKDRCHDTQELWECHKRSIRDLDELPKDQMFIGHRERYRTPEMQLDYDLSDRYTVWMIEKFGEDWRTRLEDVPPRKSYRRRCTPKELSVLDRKCGVDRIPWV